MARVTADMTITLDGFATGLDQSREKPFGTMDHARLHDWQINHRDEHPEADAITAAGAFIMGRKMFSAEEGTPWDLDWTGWWGPNPPYHAPTFVLCHEPRESIEMEGGTTFHFSTDGIEATLEKAREAAGDKDVSIAGGPGTLNQYLAAGLVDELRLHVSPFVAGEGERIFVDTPGLTLKPVSARATPHVTHLVYSR